VSVDQQPGPATERTPWEDYWADRAPGPLSRLPRPLQIALAMFISLCGGLALIYFLFAAIGRVDLAESETTTIIAAVMALIWFVAFLVRQRTGALRVQRADRERRGY
jgi:hypothetical protein